MCFLRPARGFGWLDQNIKYGRCWNDIQTPPRQNGQSLADRLHDRDGHGPLGRRFAAEVCFMRGRRTCKQLWALTVAVTTLAYKPWQGLFGQSAVLRKSPMPRHIVWLSFNDQKLQFFYLCNCDFTNPDQGVFQLVSSLVTIISQPNILAVAKRLAKEAKLEAK